MFWKRKPRLLDSTKGLGPIMLPTPPPRKEFKTMLEILRDAEKFDNAGEKEVTNNVLKNLVEYIDDFRSKNIS